MSTFFISAVGNTTGRYGIAVAAQKHVELLRTLCRHLQTCDGPHAEHDVVYHHAAPPVTPPPWYRGKRVIAYWVVESSIAAPQFKETADACAQIWTSSEASASAIRALGTETPVFVIPHPVAAPAQVPDRSGRKTVTTLMAFSPGWERKNPEGAIRAWKHAFPHTKSARLVIKMRLAGPAAIDCVREMTRGDDRIEIITQDVPDMGPLYERADIFLSLHHAGAFELHVAEAAAWGLPIVCTAVGGVLDYLTTGDEDYAALIEGKRIASRMEDPLNRCGEWVEPFGDIAAGELRKMARSRKRRMDYGYNARESVLKLLSPERVTELMAAALKQLPAEPKTAPARKAISLTPCRLAPIRPGLELAGDGRSQHAPPVVISHRRSGTHLLGELIARHWQTPWLKTHHFPDMLPQQPAPVGVLRNPIDCLHSTWQWWQHGAANDEIAAVVRGMSFEEWLLGMAGPALGFRSHKTKPVDSLEVGRGSMYDPIKYWLHHWLEVQAAGIPIVLYEDLIGGGIGDHVTAVLTKVMRRNPVTALEVVSEGVGIAPSSDHAPGKAMTEWPERALSRLSIMLKPDMLRSVNRKNLEDWLTPR